VAFTLDRYGHLFPEADERLRARLDEMFVIEPDPVGWVAEMPLGKGSAA
jgi:hypothetical protein